MVHPPGVLLAAPSSVAPAPKIEIGSSRQSWASSAAVRNVMRANKKRDSGPELRIRSAAHRLGLRFFVLRRPEASLRVVADLVFPGAKVAVFVDGCFWHGCPVHGTKPRTNSPYWDAKIQGNVRRDRLVDDQLAEAGWQPVHIWEHEDAEDAALALADVINGRREAARASNTR